MYSPKRRSSIFKVSQKETQCPSRSLKQKLKLLETEAERGEGREREEREGHRGQRNE